MFHVIICSSHNHKQFFARKIVVVPGLGEFLEPTQIQSAQQMPNVLVKHDVILSSKPGSKIPSTNFQLLRPTQKKPTILPLIMMTTTFGATKPCCDPSFANNTRTTTDARILITNPISVPNTP